jgi:hypothetical protein
MQARRGCESAVVERRLGRGPAGLAALAFGIAVLLWIVPQAKAGDTLFWSNYSGDSLGFANIDGSGGGAVNVGSAKVDDSEGLTIDSAGGRLIWTNLEGGVEKNGGIFFTNLDGSGSGPLNTGSATVDDPNAIAVDPVTGTVYWSNYEGGPGNKGTISFAKLDGSASGDLNVSGAVVNSPEPIAIDTASSRIYWGNGNGTIYFANLAGGGGGQLNTSGAPPVQSPSGMAIDPVSGRLFWVSSGEDTVSFASLGGGGGGILSTTPATVNNAYGLALDPVAGRLYIGNYGQEKERLGAISTVALSGGSGIDLNISTAPVDGPQNPIILRAPSAASPPTVTGKATFRSVLTCSTGGWAADFAGSYLYQAPHTYAYQWVRNGAPIAGANASTFTIASAGSYGCTVTAANQAGSAVQSSPVLKVRPAKLLVKMKTRKVEAEPGTVGVFKFSVANKGDMPGKARLCVKAKKKAKRALKRPKCAALGKLNAGKQRAGKLRVKVDPSAEAGSYKLNFKVKGASGKSASAKLIVKAGK